MTVSLAKKIEKQIDKFDNDTVFLSRRFFTLGKRANIDKILSRLATKGKIKRIMNGIYYKPIIHKRLGVIPSDLNKFLQAIILKTGEKIYPSGASCANMLHLSTQVQAKNIFWTTGKTRFLKTNDFDVYLKHTNMIPFDDTPNRVFMTVFAFDNLAGNYRDMDDKIIKKCRKFLKKDDNKYISDMMLRTPYQLAKNLQQLIQ